MATISTPQRVVVQRPRSPHSDTDQQQQIFLALQVPQIPLQRRWILELVNLFLTKLPPAQPPLPSLLPRFNLSPRTQAAPLHIQPPSRLPSFSHPISLPPETTLPPPAPRQKDQTYYINYLGPASIELWGCDRRAVISAFSLCFRAGKAETVLQWAGS